MRSIEIPLPPLDEQAAIVKALDSFTELDIQISSELDLRRRQNEYFRGMLLTFSEPNVA